MRKKRTWYKKAEYNEPFDPKELGDGSIVECIADPDDRHPTALKLTRIWPDNHVTVVRKTPPTEFSEAIYLEVKGDREPAPAKPKQSLDEQLSSGTYHAPFAITASVPGNKPGDTWDSATQRNFDTREKFNRYYREHHLEKVSPNDRVLDGPSEPAVPSRVAGYDVSKGPPVPSGFEGARFVTIGE